MAPIRSYSNWKIRPSNKEKQIEPYKHYFFICEGQNTEKWYFERFIDMKKEFSISALVSIDYLEKTDEHKTWSNPKKLYELSEICRQNGTISFDPKHDTMILVFDTDIYENQDSAEYERFVKQASKTNTLCVTNPKCNSFYKTSFKVDNIIHFGSTLNLDGILQFISAIIKYI